MSSPARPARPATAQRGRPARGAPRVPRPRALFYSHDARGLGQLRRVLALAGAVLERQPQTLCLIVSGSLETHAFPTPRNIDIVKLPALTRAPLYAGLPGDPSRSGVGELAGLREALLHQTIEAFAPQLLYVDGAPAGLHGELRRTLARLRSAPSRPRLVLGLTDLADVDAWNADGSVDLIEHDYADVLLFDEYDPAAGQCFPPAAEAKLRYCGYLGTGAPGTPASAIRARLSVEPEQPLVVVSVGGGAEGCPLLRAWLAAMQRPELAGVAACVVTGPLLAAPTRAELTSLAAQLPNVTLLPFVSDLPSYLNAADLVVTHGGYTTLVETLSLGKRTLAMSSVDVPAQRARVERFAQRGQLTVLPSTDLTPERLARAAQHALAQPAGDSLATHGAERAAERLALAWAGGAGTDEEGTVSWLEAAAVVTADLTARNQPTVPCSLFPVPSASVPAPRVLLYSHDGYGLGHTRVNMTVATELARRWPEAAFLLLSSAMTAHAHELPANFDYMRLPSVGKEDLYMDLPLTGTTPGRLKGYYRLREALVLEAVNGFAPDLVWVDDSPSGIGGDLVRALACLRAADPPVALVFGTKDISDRAHVVQRNWGHDGSYYVLDNIYDRILIYSDPRFYDSCAGFGFGPAAVAKTRYCGFLVRDDPFEPAELVRTRLGVRAGQPLLVVTAGGGADGGELSRAVLAALREPALAGAAAFIATGPLLATDEQARLAELAEGLPNVSLTPFTTQLRSFLNAADLVITMGGLTVYEALKLRKRMLIVPRVRWWAEQLLRAERLTELGLASMLLPSELSGTAVARIASAMLAEPPPHADLDYDGVRRVGDELVAVLEHMQRQPAARSS